MKQSIFKLNATASLLCILLSIATSLSSNAQTDTWEQKSDVGYDAANVTEPTAREGAIGFSIGNKGYVGTGYGYAYDFYKDFWEYDPELNTWTQKADFAGTARNTAVGFSIDNKGYIGTGYDGVTYQDDFWEYDPVLNSWTQKANYGGGGRYGAVGFSIGSKGYLGTGNPLAGGSATEFWQYNPVVDVWTKKANFGGPGRWFGVGFGIGNKGYIGTGYSNPGYYIFHYHKDFWEYDTTANTWTKKANFGGRPRRSAVGFSISNKGFIGTGIDGKSGKTYKDFWEYDPDMNHWTQKADFGGHSRFGAVGFSIENNGFLGTGISFDGTILSFKDFWKYIADTSFCIEPANLSATNISSSSAKLKWNLITGAIGYTIRYKMKSASEWTIIKSANNQKTLSVLNPNTEYTWQVNAICGSQPLVSSDWSENQFFTTDALRSGEPEQTTFEIYPNPVSQFATVSFYLRQNSHALIEIMDLRGKTVQLISEGDFSEGNHQIIFNCASQIAGIYFLQIKTDHGVMTKKLIIE